MSESKSNQQDKRRSDGTASYKGPKPLPAWYKPVMFGLMILGLLWIMVFYISQTQYPIAAAGSWNILIGFGLALIGFLMTTRWR